MAKTIFSDTDRAALLARIDRLSATAPAAWGKFTAPKMVAHCISAVRMALGDEPCAPRQSVLSNALVRYLVIYHLPWPKGAPTAPELLARVPDTWDADVAALKHELNRAAANGVAGRWVAHPAFGDLSPHAWGVLIHRHLSHHLTQFGA